MFPSHKGIVFCPRHPSFRPPREAASPPPLLALSVLIPWTSPSCFLRCDAVREFLICSAKKKNQKTKTHNSHFITLRILWESKSGGMSNDNCRCHFREGLSVASQYPWSSIPRNPFGWRYQCAQVKCYTDQLCPDAVWLMTLRQKPLDGTSKKAQQLSRLDRWWSSSL